MLWLRETCLSLTVLVLCMGFQSVRLEEAISDSSETGSVATTTAEGLETQTESDLENSVLPLLPGVESQRSLAPDHVLNAAQYENGVEPPSEKSAAAAEVDEVDAWEAPFNMAKDYTYYLAGHDDENRPIWIFELGRWNVRTIVEEGGPKLEAFNKYVRQMIHRVLKSMEDISTPEFPVNELLFLVDFEDLKLEQLAHVPTVSFVLNLAQEHLKLMTKYLGGTVIVNTNFVAENLINILRPIYGPLFEKVEIYGNNKVAWLPKVLRKFPRDQIPEWYGGSKSFRPIKVYG